MTCRISLKIIPGKSLIILSISLLKMFNPGFPIFNYFLFLHILSWNVLGLQSQEKPAKCFDEISNCEKRVAQDGCAGDENGIEHALDMLTLCRESCKQFYANSSELPEKLEILGGVDDEVENVFGERCVEAIIRASRHVDTC